MVLYIRKTMKGGEYRVQDKSLSTYPKVWILPSSYCRFITGAMSPSDDYGAVNAFTDTVCEDRVCNCTAVELEMSFTFWDHWHIIGTLTIQGGRIKICLQCPRNMLEGTYAILQNKVNNILKEEADSLWKQAEEKEPAHSSI